MATIEAVEITNAKDDQLEVTLRGKTEEVVKVLVGGLPREALLQVRDALADEIAIRRSDEASGSAR